MPELLDSKETSDLIEKIITSADETVYLIFPVFRFSHKIYEFLKNTSNRGTGIIIVFRTDELTPVEKIHIAELHNIEVYCSSELNACCYFNESEMLFSSMNINDIHERKSGDINLYFDKINDEKIYNEIKVKCQALIESSVQLVPGNNEKSGNSNDPEIYHGFCIRCGMPVTFNLNRPYCRQCLADYKNIKTENYCHLCAEKMPVSAENPLCDRCIIKISNVKM